MFGKSITLFRVFGIAIRMNVSWTFIAILIAWSLAEGLFPQLYSGWPKTTYWWAALGGVIGLFFSIVVHELSHSLVARAYGMPIRSITLFIFGGVAQMERDPPSPRVEFLMAIAGPIISAVLAVLFFQAHYALQAANAAEPLTAVAEYLGLLNAVLAIFNMIPAFPLDGGRVLRAILWGLRGNLLWATRWASRMGSAFGLALIAAGIIWVLTGNFIAGLWWFLIGMFVRAAARGSYYQQEIRHMLEGVPVKLLMSESIPPASPQMTVRELVEERIYEYHQELFPVVDGRLVGCVSVTNIKTVPRNRWDTVKVSDIMTPCGNESTISPEGDVMDALARMQSTGAARLLVIDDGDLLGTLSLQDVMAHLALKIDLESAN